MSFKKLLTLGLILAVPSVVVKGRNQDNTGQQQPDPKERTAAVNLVRALNTAEMAYRDQSRGSFADLNGLTQSRALAEALDRFSRSSPMLKDIKLSTAEVMRGWKLRLLVSSDKKSYLIVLLSSDKCVGFESDEEGTIRKVSSAGCSAPGQP